MMLRRIASTIASTVIFLLPFGSSAALIAFGDGVPPAISEVTPTSATVNQAVTLRATVSDASGIQSCNLYVESSDVGSMAVSGLTASKSYTFIQAGVHTVFVFCRDNSGSFNSGPNTAVVVSAAGGDTSPPTVGSISPAAATANVPATFSATYSDVGTGVSSCTLIVDGANKGTMTLSAGVASISYTFTAAGTFTVWAQCTDGAGNTRGGTGTLVTVSAGAAPPLPPSEEPPPGPATPGPGSLIKLACAAGAPVDDPCKAVYYYGSDGKRHAFPNQNIYYTWYADFSTVQTVTPSFLASLPLGRNVAYRPGVKLVKFATLAKVYAVSRGGMLRWITTEDAASALYGTDWNRKIDDISDAFFTDYQFGTDIASSADYNPASETTAASTIDANL